MNMSEPCIVLENVNKTFKLFHGNSWKILDFFGFSVPGSSYAPFTVYRDLNLTVEKGERVGLIGRNGAGKSTLLNLICGRLMPTSGTITVNGKIQALMEIGTGFHPHFTGRDNIYSSLAYNGILGKDADAVVDEIIDFAEIGEFIDQPVQIYSSGMYARLAFAVSTAVVPEILIIDEVLGVGDARFAAKSAARMHDLTVNRGTTVLFVSHDMSAVERICTRACWIKNGEIVMDAAPKEVATAYHHDVTMEEEARLRARNAKYTGKGAECGQNSSSAPGGMEESQPLWDIDAAGKYNSKALSIVSCRPCNPQTLEEKYTFALAEPLGLLLELDAAEAIEPCSVVCLLFDALGNLLAVPDASIQRLPAGKNTVCFSLPAPNLRDGEYSVNVEIYKTFDKDWNESHRMPFEALWYRGVSFQVRESRIGTINFGRISLSADLKIVDEG